RHLGVDRGHVDQGSAVRPFPEMAYGGVRAVHHAPIVGFEQALVVRGRHVLQFREHHDAGVVDPGGAASVRADGRLGDTLDLLFVTDVGDCVGGLAALVADLFADLAQDILVARGQYQPGARPGRAPGRGQADTRGRPGNDDDLLAELAITVPAHDAFLHSTWMDERPRIGRLRARSRESHCRAAAGPAPTCDGVANAGPLGTALRAGAARSPWRRQ